MPKDYGRIDFNSAKKDFIEELRKAKEELNRESDGVTDVIGDNWDDGVESSVRKIKASSIKLSGAFKNLRESINKQVQILTSEFNGKKFNTKIDFSNIDINSDKIKQRISEIISSFKDEGFIEFDVKGSEKQFENLISLYVKYEEKLKSLREVQRFSSNEEAVQNLKEQVVLASRLQEIFRFLDRQTNVSLPMLMGNRETSNIINTSIAALERFNAVKKETEKTKVSTGDFKNIEEILRSLKETIEGIKGSLEPISEIFKNEGNAMQTMAANGISSFNSLSEAVNALYNNLKNVESAVDSISKKKFEVTNITQNVQKSIKDSLLKIDYKNAAKQLYQLNSEDISDLLGLQKLIKDPAYKDKLTGLRSELGASSDLYSIIDNKKTTKVELENIYKNLLKSREVIKEIVSYLNQSNPSLNAKLQDFQDIEKVKTNTASIIKSSEKIGANSEDINRLVEALQKFVESLEPFNKALTTSGTLLNQMATSGALSMDTLIEKLKEVVSLSTQLTSGKAPVGATNTYTDVPKGEGQVRFDLDAAGELPDTKDSIAGLAEEKKEFKELGESAKAAADGKNEFNEANRGVERGAKDSIAGILEEAAAMEELEESAKSVWTTPREGGSIPGMNLPVQIVGENGQDAVRMFSEVKDRLENEFHSPVQIRFQSAPNEEGQLEATRATVSYINKELGVSISQIYDIKKNEDGVLVATQSLEKAVIGAAKETKKFDSAMEQALAKERLETFRKRCGSIQIDLTNVAEAANNITDDESLKKFNKELEIVGEKLKQVKVELKGENTLDTIASAEKKLMTLPTQVDTFRKKLSPLLKLEGAEDVSKKLDDIMVSYSNFMSTDDADIKIKEFKNIINNLSVIKTLMSNLKMDDSMSKFNEVSKKQVESYKKIVEYRNKLNSGTLGTEESKVVAERLKAEQKNFIQLGQELKTYGSLYNSEDRLKLLSEARLKVLEKIEETQAKAADRKAKRAEKQRANYGKSTYNSATRKYDRTLGDFENIDDGKATEEMIAAMDKYKKKYDELTAARQRFIDNPALADNQSERNAFNSTAKAVEDARKKVQLYIDDMQKLRQVEEDGLLKGDTALFDPNGVDKATDAIKKYADTLFGGKLQITGWNDAGNEMYGTLNKGKGVIESVTVALDRGTNTLYAYGKGTKEVGTIWQQFTTGISRKTKEIATYIAGGASIYQAIAAVRQGVQYVKELDSALTELKKVTNETDSSYAKFVKTMSGVGAEIGATVTDLTNMAASWARLGYSMEQASSLAESTAVLLNVSEFKDAETASEALISTLQAYGYAADESMQVVDVLNEVGKIIARR